MSTGLSREQVLSAIRSHIARISGPRYLDGAKVNVRFVADGVFVLERVGFSTAFGVLTDPTITRTRPDRTQVHGEWARRRIPPEYPLSFWGFFTTTLAQAIVSADHFLEGYGGKPLCFRQDPEAIPIN